MPAQAGIHDLSPTPKSPHLAAAPSKASGRFSEEKLRKRLIFMLGQSQRRGQSQNQLKPNPLVGLNLPFALHSRRSPGFCASPKTGIARAGVSNNCRAEKRSAFRHLSFPFRRRKRQIQPAFYTNISPILPLRLKMAEGASLFRPTMAEFSNGLLDQWRAYRTLCLQLDLAATSTATLARKKATSGC